MSSTFPFLSPNNLAEFQMIGGTSQKLYFDVYTSASVAVPLAGATCTWNLAVYGQTTPTLTKTAVISGSPTNRIQINLDPADTATLNGKYLHQFVLTDTSGSVYIPSQGIITIVGKLA
jgi:hypothetical protein